MFPNRNNVQKVFLSAAFPLPKCGSGGTGHIRKGAAKLTAPCSVTCLLFSFLSFRLSRFALSLPFPELPLAFLAFVVGENIREDAPGNVLNLMLRNTGIVDELLSTAQAGCSLRFDMKFLRCWLCVGGRSVLAARPPSENGKCRRLSSCGLIGVCILFGCIIAY